MRITGHAPDVSGFRPLIGNVPALLYWLGVTWTFAAFGEEMVYRGYLLNRAADLFGHGAAGWAIAAVVSSLLFAVGHAYQGFAGMIDVAVGALIPVIAYFATGRNLWVPIIMHGTGDTLGFIFIFLHK
jgi:membrane protease YdiL (CAAX protease family)